MPQELMQLKFEDSNVRMWIDQHGDPWWVLADACHVLDISNIGNAITRLESNEYRDDIRFTDAIGRQQNMTVINEQGLYRLIFRSNKPEAKRFQNWIFGEVLPQIRKTGRYEISPITQLPSAEERALSILRIYEHADRLGLADGYTRILAIELTQNLMKETQAPGQLLPAEKSTTDNYFMIEDLREQLQMSKQRWFGLRSIFGKIARTAIQAADENVKPLKVKKFVNGNEHEVNAWPIEYRDIAIAAIERYIGRKSD